MTDGETPVKCDGALDRCPNCGTESDEELNAHPWCPNDGCRVFTFLRA